MILDPNRLWTFEEARYYLRVGESTLRKYIRSGRLPAVRVGGDDGRLLLFKKQDLDDLLVPIKTSELRKDDLEDDEPFEEGPAYEVLKPMGEER